MFRHTSHKTLVLLAIGAPCLVSNATRGATPDGAVDTTFHMAIMHMY